MYTAGSIRGVFFEFITDVHYLPIVDCTWKGAGKNGIFADNPLKFKMVALRTKTGGSFSTYTAAGHVRRTLQNVGFNVTRKKGFFKMLVDK